MNYSGVSMDILSRKIINRNMGISITYPIPETKYFLINKKTKKVYRGTYLFMNPSKSMAYFEDLVDCETNTVIKTNNNYQKWIDLQVYLIMG